MVQTQPTDPAPSPRDKKPENDDESEDEFYVARFPPDEEAKLLAESNTYKEEANKQFAAAAYTEALSTYDRALASCPNYLDYEIAVLRSNIAACYLKLQDWKSAVDAATASIECLDRCIPKRKDGDTDSSTKSAGNDGQHGVIELAAGEDEKTQLERLDREDSRRRDVQRIRAKALLRRARARTELDGWANLQGAEEDYKELSTMDNLPAQDRKFVQKALRELPPRIHVAREKEMAEMMGKLKELGNGILKPFGLSTDNFKLIKDEKTGGYSVQFQR
ncbi:hypothetical protein VTN49DRAFT_1068 [Thermomyces lanuginosus]|uniref:uncharacterized protein n=1 Tax=Thermomyces lanuginosus TaxID=5541 RepID=UPI0037448259